MFNVKASITVMSHLSDIQHGGKIDEIANLRINFIKYLINEVDGDLSKEINSDKMWEDFNNQYNK